MPIKQHANHICSKTLHNSSIVTICVQLYITKWHVNDDIFLLCNHETQSERPVRWTNLQTGTLLNGTFNWDAPSRTSISFMCLPTVTGWCSHLGQCPHLVLDLSLTCHVTCLSQQNAALESNYGFITDCDRTVQSGSVVLPIKVGF